MVTKRISNLTTLPIPKSEPLRSWMMSTRVRIGINGGEVGIRTRGPSYPGQLLSRQLHSATLPPLQIFAFKNLDLTFLRFLFYNARSLNHRVLDLSMLRISRPFCKKRKMALPPLQIFAFKNLDLAFLRFSFYNARSLKRAIKSFKVRDLWSLQLF